MTVSKLQILLLLLLLLFVYGRHLIESKCEFKAIYNFGDSNTDTGGFWSAFPAQNSPFGMTYFNKPVGRATDGRVIIDFLAQGIGLPFISPYLKSIGSNFTNGANFATLASTVLIPNTSLFVTGISPFSLAIQINQMKQFKALAIEFHSKGSKELPAPDTFAKSLYTFYIGQNDFTSDIGNGLDRVLKDVMPKVIGTIDWSIKELYIMGGRTFMILNLAPVGCYPSMLAQIPHENSDVDEYGCMKSMNEGVVEYNEMLKKALNETRKQIPDANIIYVDVHSVLLDLFQHPTSHGLKHGIKACCGYGGGIWNFDGKCYCGNHKTINGRTITARACGDPQNYVSFDGIHATDITNKIVTQAILSGSIFEPPFAMNKLCDLQPIV
ncbi:GDSL esterase/lipase At4g01130 [Impatiens glandulifera]|uniref:GDSL esterase/lipase At4g01130 n=1 Tax=Impatiens glandulifera TaxID=253017 RepID=UPI001FB188E6|nr:GDSL esterase/lipase At4g01130 [Impatiens glandulifera]